MTILINLTGDFQLDSDGNVSDISQLEQLDAFLGALREGISAERDPFLQAIAKMMRELRKGSTSKVALQVTSRLSENRLIHDFRLLEL